MEGDCLGRLVGGWWKCSFDTGFIYGGGVHETVLGQWMTARGITKDARVVVIGCAQPILPARCDCNPACHSRNANRSERAYLHHASRQS